MQQTNNKTFLGVRAGDSEERLIKRKIKLYDRETDVRTPFERDYTRLLHSLGFRRLKNKTQVFFNTQNDHVCTRIEHVGHVESVASTISDQLGLNTPLVRAIAIGHDIGHTPFGHQGETSVRKLYKDYISEDFFHEKNSLRFVDKIELLEDEQRSFRNLDLTYAVRDGIVSHCGEVDEMGLKPRKEFIDLECFGRSGEYMPCTWEGCVVKISDKIAYIGRDIEDAVRIGFIGKKECTLLDDMAKAYSSKAVNTTNIMGCLISDLCRESSPEKGIALSQSAAALMNETKKFNERFIYRNKKFDYYNKYVDLIINSLFSALDSMYDGKDTIKSIWQKYGSVYRELSFDFCKWLLKYCDEDVAVPEVITDNFIFLNEKIYRGLDDIKLYRQAVLDYISGMTDRFAIKTFEELINF